MNKPNNMRNGSVLVVVLIMVAFITTLAMVAFVRSNDGYTGVVSVHAENQGNIYTGTVVAAIKALMVYDDAAYDGITDEWVAIPGIAIEDGFLSVEIRAADDRLPINSLLNADNTTMPRVQRAFETLFSELEYDPSAWYNIYDWVTDADTPAKNIYVKDEIFNQGGNTYTAKFGAIDSLAELRLIPGFADEYARLTNYLCVGDKDARININFAKPEVIRALMPELDSYVDQIVELRAEQPFKNKDEIYALLGDRTVYTAILPYFDVKSVYYYVRIELNMKETNKYYHVLMKRSGRNMNTVRYIEGRGINYF